MILHVLDDEIGTAIPIRDRAGIDRCRILPEPHHDTDLSILTITSHQRRCRNPANAPGSRNMNGTKVSPPWTSPRGEFLLLLPRRPVTSPHRHHHTFIVTLLSFTLRISSLSTADPHHPSLMRITINAKWESLLKQLRIYSLLLLSEPSLPPGCREHFHLQRNTSLITFDMVVFDPNSDLNKLVLDWLIIEGYRDAAVSFASELELDAQASQPSTSISESISNPGKIDFDSIHERMLIRESIEAGRIDEAVRRVNELDSEVSVNVPVLSYPLRVPAARIRNGNDDRKQPSR